MFRQAQMWRAIRYDTPCVSKLFTNPFSYLVPTHVLYLALVLVLPTMTSISVFHRVLTSILIHC